MLCPGRIGRQAPLPAPCRDPSGRNRRAVAGVTILTILSLAISGCAVGPNFSPAAAPDVDGYVPGKLASPDPGRGGPPARRASRRRSALCLRGGRVGTLVVGVQIPAAQ